VNVSWTSSAGMQNKSVGFVNPPRTLGIGSKVATVTGTIGSFTVTNANAELSQRNIVP